MERWSVAECERQGLPPDPSNKREVLGDALYLVRMPLMSPEEFQQGPVKSGMLNEEEIRSVTHRVNGKDDTKYVSKVRKETIMFINIYFSTKT